MSKTHGYISKYTVDSQCLVHVCGFILFDVSNTSTKYTVSHQKSSTYLYLLRAVIINVLH